jgi:Flp pilus assembly protein TadG
LTTREEGWGVEAVLLRRRREERGASAVEFALVMLPFMILVLGMIQYGWYFFVSQSTGSSASNVARRLAVGDCWGTGQATNFAKGQGVAVTSVSVTNASNNTADLAALSVGDAFTVSVISDADILGFLPMPNGGDVERTVQTRLEDKTADTSCA